MKLKPEEVTEEGWYWVRGCHRMDDPSSWRPVEVQLRGDELRVYDGQSNWALHEKNGAEFFGPLTPPAE